jgi:hypothetical protein
MTNYLALFLDTEFSVIGSKKFKATDIFINFKKGAFKVRLDAYLYKIKDTQVHVYIYPTDERVLFDTIKKDYVLQEAIFKDDIDTKTKKDTKIEFNSARLVSIQEKIEHGDLHLLVTESIVGQLARLALNAVKTNWVLIILAVVAGLAIGYIVGNVTTPTHTITLIQNVTNTPTPTPIYIRGYP